VTATLWSAGAAALSLWTAAAFAVWPFANCRRCDGRGRFRNPIQSFLRRYIYCSVCRGTGRRFAPKGLRLRVIRVLDGLHARLYHRGQLRAAHRVGRLADALCRPRDITGSNP
jgi:hypothetical protein